MVATRMINYPSWSRQNPFAAMNQMAREMDWLTNNMFGRPDLRWMPAKVFPAVNITENGDKYYVRAELPGIKAEDINVEITGKKLTMSGERKIKSEGETVRYHRRERESGRFSRVIGLPGDIDANTVKAEMVNGILTVEISKSEASKPKKITVN